MCLNWNQKQGCGKKRYHLLRRSKNKKKILSSWNLHHRWWKSSFFLFKHKISRVAWDTRNPLWINEDHLVRLNTLESLIVKSTVRERWKRTPIGEWKRLWNLKQSICGRFDWPLACWRMSRRLIVFGRVKETFCNQSENKSQNGDFCQKLWTRTRVI